MLSYPQLILYPLLASQLLLGAIAQAIPSSSADVETRTRVSQSAASVATSNNMRVLDSKRKLMAGDVLSFRIVEDGPAITRIIVTDSGEVEIPYIGRVSAKDQTCATVARNAKKLLEKDYYYQATVLLGLDYNTYGSRNSKYAHGTNSKTHAISAKTGYTIMGEIGAPGVFALPQDETFTISHAILRSGGFQRFANEKNVRLLRKRKGSAEPQTYKINVHDIMSRGVLKHDLPLQPGDVIIVDRKLINF